MTQDLVLRALLFLLVLTSACGDDDRARVDASIDGDLDTSTATDTSAPDVGSDTAVGGDTLGADTASPDTGASADAQVDLVFSGCGPSFDGDIVVVRNAESIAVSATSSGALTGSIQLALEVSAPATINVSTRDRVDNMNVINVIEGTTFTNIARDSAAVLSEGAPDPIQGTLSIARYDEGAGEVDVTFSNVALQNPSDGRVCTINGRLQTFGLSF